MTSEETMKGRKNIYILIPFTALFLFENRALHFYFVQGPTNYIVVLISRHIISIYKM